MPKIPELAGSQLEAFVKEWPEEIRPIMGTLHYQRFPRAKLLINDLVEHVVYYMTEPPYAEWKMSAAKIRDIFTTLDRYLVGEELYPCLGPEIQDLIATAKAITSEDQIPTLEAYIKAGENTPGVQETITEYMTDRQTGTTRCFYCNREIDEDGSNSSTEMGVYYACDQDWPIFGNPDEFI